MSASDRRLAHRLVAAAALAVFAVIVASAFIRHAQATHPAATDVARILHRIGATSALLVIVMVPFMLLRGDALRSERRLAQVALVIVIALALLGVATPGSTSPLVAIGNMTGGFLLLATLAVLLSRLREAPVTRDRVVPAAVGCALAALATGAVAWAAPSLAATLAHNATSALAMAGLAAAYLGRTSVDARDASP
jgi:heme A synthase